MCHAPCIMHHVSCTCIRHFAPAYELAQFTIVHGPCTCNEPAHGTSDLWHLILARMFGDLHNRIKEQEQEEVEEECPIQRNCKLVLQEGRLLVLTTRAVRKGEKIQVSDLRVH